MNTTTRKDQAGAQTEKAREEARAATEKVKEAATHTGQAISSAASAVGQKADDLTASAGSGTRSLAGTVREQGPESGMLGKASHAVADALEQSGRYLEQKQLSGMVEDIGEMIRRNPLPAVLIGVGIGFLLGRAMRS